MARHKRFEIYAWYHHEVNSEWSRILWIRLFTKFTRTYFRAMRDK